MNLPSRGSLLPPPAVDAVEDGGQVEQLAARFEEVAVEDSGGGHAVQAS